MAELELEFKRLGEEWILLRFGQVIGDEVTQRVQHAYEYLKEQDFVEECIPTYTDIAVRAGGDALAWRAEEWRALVSTLGDRKKLEPNRLVEVPVRFVQSDDESFDLHYYAQTLEQSVDAIVAQLLATEFTVAMVGFLPGMPYLSGLPANLHLPRREQLATALPGTFAIGGQQAGFLPNQTLTGWWRLGWTDVSIFDLDNPSTSLFKMGDTVRLIRGK